MDDPQLLSWIDKGKNIAAFLVALGVAGEFFGDFLSRPITRRQEAERQREITRLSNENLGLQQSVASLQTEAANARTRQAEAEKDVAQANERASKAEQKAEEIRQQNLKLEAIIQPRNFTVEHQQRMAAACRPFVGHKVTVRSYSLDLEAGLLGQQIIVALKSGGLDVHPAIASIVPLGGFSVGVLVSGPEGEKSLMEAIGSSLLEANIVTTGNITKEDTVAVLVGVKPLPTMK